MTLDESSDPPLSTKGIIFVARSLLRQFLQRADFALLNRLCQGWRRVKQLIRNQERMVASFIIRV